MILSWRRDLWLNKYAEVSNETVRFSELLLACSYLRDRRGRLYFSASSCSFTFGPCALLAAILGGALGFCYFAQQQKLEESRLFKELFTEFNRRYDEMNGPLEDIRAGRQPIGPDQEKTLVDYFNLCSEEYLFYAEGYIHPNVWRSWCRGMMCYFEKKPIREFWEDQSKQDLILDSIRKGCRARRLRLRALVVRE